MSIINIESLFLWHFLKIRLHHQWRSSFWHSWRNQLYLVQHQMVDADLVYRHQSLSLQSLEIGATTGITIVRARHFRHRNQRYYKLPLPSELAISSVEDPYISSSSSLEGDHLHMNYNHHHQTCRSSFLCEQQFISIARLHRHCTYIIPTYLQF